MPQEKIDVLSIEYSAIANDTSNFNDENKVEHKLDASKSYTKISKLEELRTSYRKKHKELKILSGISYEEFHGENVKKMLMLFKTYTRGANRLKKDLAEMKLLVDLKPK